MFTWKRFTPSRICYLEKQGLTQKSREKIQKSGKKTTKSREKIISLLSEDGRLTAVGLSKIIGITPKAIEKHLARLKSEGIIERIGPDKGGMWIVKDVESK